MKALESRVSGVLKELAAVVKLRYLTMPFSLRQRVLRKKLATNGGNAADMESHEWDATGQFQTFAVQGQAKITIAATERNVS